MKRASSSDDVAVQHLTKRVRRSLQSLLEVANESECGCGASEWGCAADARVEQLSGPLVRMCSRGAEVRRVIVSAGLLDCIQSVLTDANDVKVASALCVLAAMVQWSDGLEAVMPPEGSLLNRIIQLARGADTYVVQEAALQVLRNVVQAPEGAALWRAFGDPMAAAALQATRSLSHPVADVAVQLVVAIVLAEDHTSAGAGPEGATHAASSASAGASLQQQIGDTFQKTTLAVDAGEMRLRVLDAVCLLVPHLEGRRFIAHYCLGTLVLDSLATCPQTPPTPAASDPVTHVRHRAVDAAVAFSMHPGGIALLVPRLERGEALESPEESLAALDSLAEGGSAAGGVRALRRVVERLQGARERRQSMFALRLLGSVRLADASVEVARDWLQRLDDTTMAAWRALGCHAAPTDAVPPTIAEMKDAASRTRPASMASSMADRGVAPVPALPDARWAVSCYSAAVSAWALRATHDDAADAAGRSGRQLATEGWLRSVMRVLGACAADTTEPAGPLLLLRRNILRGLSADRAPLPRVQCEHRVTQVFAALVESAFGSAAEDAVRLRLLRRLLLAWPALQIALFCHLEAPGHPRPDAVSLPQASPVPALPPPAVLRGRLLRLLLRALLGTQGSPDDGVAPASPMATPDIARGADAELDEELQEEACVLAGALLGGEAGDAATEWALQSSLHLRLTAVAAAGVSGGNDLGTTAMVGGSVAAAALAGLSRLGSSSEVRMKEVSCAVIPGLVPHLTVPPPPAKSTAGCAALLAAGLQEEGLHDLRLAALRCSGAWLGAPARAAAELATGLVRASSVDPAVKSPVGRSSPTTGSNLSMPPAEQRAATDPAASGDGDRGRAPRSFAMLLAALRQSLWDEDSEIRAAALEAILPAAGRAGEALRSLAPPMPEQSVGHELADGPQGGGALPSCADAARWKVVVALDGDSAMRAALDRPSYSLVYSATLAVAKVLGCEQAPLFDDAVYAAYNNEATPPPCPGDRVARCEAFDIWLHQLQKSGLCGRGTASLEMDLEETELLPNPSINGDQPSDLGTTLGIDAMLSGFGHRTLDCY
ncbi:hypothetical protein CYMTET_12206 [Cymbomonas tetramitiformis]|uniref:Uncharacterized protein n=1 Tax=Cymbomonas tetramitiformis TaxID=36881 RepID=A0AAE0GKI9_9CHLO|nr:hypothetical protein CYMTET_12206 [Cymbomonas tetramitiformis]